MNVLPNELQDAPSLLEHWCKLDFTKDPEQRRMSSIVCTIGPSSRNVDVIYQMIKAGMNIARINFSHENHEEHQLSIEYIQQAVQKYSKELGFNYHVAIAGDLKGREIRTGILANRRPVEVKRGDVMKLSINPDLSNKCTKDIVYVDYPNIIKDVEAGQRIFLDDTLISLEIREVGVDCLMCQVLLGGLLSNRVSVVVAGAALGLPVVSEKDAYDIKFCVEHNFDFLFLSKMRTAEDIRAVRKVLGVDRSKRIKMITKLENAEALNNIDELMAESDGILYARVDLGIELKSGRVFLAQKAVAARCNRMGKPFIVGTQLLPSMLAKPVAQHGEIVDVGNALVDGADGLMLSSETSLGNYPIEAVKSLASACREAEAAIWHRKLSEDLIANNPAAVDGAHAVAISVVTTALKVLASAIIVVTVSGKSAYLVSAYRPRCPIMAVTRCSRVARQGNLYRGILPILVSTNRLEDHIEDVESRVNYALTIAHRMGIVKTGDAIVILSPWKSGSGFTNNVHVVYAYFEKDPIECMVEKQNKVVDKPAVRRFLGV